MVLCSNVGGICSCQEIGNTDSLVDNADGTYTHTALDGTPEIINICEALELDDCFFQDSSIAGVGTTLLPNPIPPGTPDTEVEPPTFTVLNNPSTLSNMQCEIHWSGGAVSGRNLFGPANSDLSLQIQTTIDGGTTWQLWAAMDATALFDVVGTPGETVEIGLPGVTQVISIPPGGNETVGFRRLYASINGFDGSAFADTSIMTTSCLAAPNTV